MDSLLWALVALLVFALVVSVLPLIYAAWRRVIARDDLQMWRAIRRSGLAPKDAAGDDRKLALAVRRCTLCPSIPECDDWLASGRREGLDLFCPNAVYFKELERARKR